MSDLLSGDFYLGKINSNSDSNVSSLHMASYHSNDEQIFTQSVDHPNLQSVMTLETSCPHSYQEKSHKMIMLGLHTSLQNMGKKRCFKWFDLPEAKEARILSKSLCAVFFCLPYVFLM